MNPSGVRRRVAVNAVKLTYYSSRCIILAIIFYQIISMCIFCN
jgi:hypothetical protein